MEMISEFGSNSGGIQQPKHNQAPPTRRPL